jgi:DNA-binding MarR family transcriptional regulator
VQLDPDQLERVAQQCVCANVRRAARAITNLYDDFLQPSGLLVTQFLLLGTLAAQPSIALTPLADKLGMDPTTLARNLKPLERDGLVQIANGTDRRTRIVKITTRGQTILAKAIPLWEQAQTWVIGKVGKDRVQLLVGDLGEVATLSRQ